MTSESSINSDSTMSDLLGAYPGAQRALFRRYHIGGCSSCAFQPQETLAQVCQRNQIKDVEEVLEHIRTSHEQDARIWMEPSELAERLKNGPVPQLIDVRTRQEFEAVHIVGSRNLSQDLVQEMMSKWPREQTVVIIDHQGRQALDASAFFLGHNFQDVRCLKGGIDAWSERIDPSLPRYQLA